VAGGSMSLFIAAVVAGC